MDSNPEFDRENNVQPGGILTMIMGALANSTNVTVDPTCNFQILQSIIEGRNLGVMIVYLMVSSEGPTRVHTQARNMIRRRKLAAEPVNVRTYLYSTMEKMAKGVTKKVDT